MMSHRQTLAAAFEHLQAGRIAEAEQLCRQVIATEPNSADAWHLLGLVVSPAGRLAEAKDHLSRALALNPQDPDIHNNVGLAWQRLGRFDEAIPFHQAAIELQPTAAEPHYNLAVAFQAQGRLREAIEQYRRAIERKPDFVAAHNNLGNCLKDVGHCLEAIDCFRRALAIDPQSVEAHNNLGNVLLDLGRLDEAERAYRRSVELDPQRARPRHNLGLVLQKRGDWDGALGCFRQAVMLDPEYLDAHISLGNLLNELGFKVAAVAAYRPVLELDPRSHDALHNTAVVLQSQMQLAEAEPYVAALLQYHPNSARGWAVRAQLQQMRAQADVAIESLERAFGLQPSAELGSKLLFAQQYRSDPDPQRLLALHRQWDDTYARGLMPASPRRGSVSEKLKIGLISKDFQRHPISFLALRAIESLDKSACSISCYCDGLVNDEFTARWRKTADVWRDSGHLTDEALATQIRDDQIDILVDLMGHTADRLLTFARKPAPVQITWFGYVGTTGLAAMDFLLADRFYVPFGEESHYSEKVLRMPQAYACYGPPGDVPEVAALPALETGAITFASFNNPAKYSPAILDAWAEILRRVRDSRLILKYGGLEDPTLRAYLQDRFHRRGIQQQQLLIESRSPPTELFAAYNRVDLALDTQPYSGGLTTCEALWMGVPVITFPGRTFAGRHAYSYLSNAGLNEFIAADITGYIDLAVHWANRPHDLAAIRAELRETFRRSPVCDAAQFARDFLSTLKHAAQSVTLR